MAKTIAIRFLCSACVHREVAEAIIALRTVTVRPHPHPADRELTCHVLRECEADASFHKSATRAARSA